MRHATGMDPLFLEFQLALVGRYSLDRELGRGGMGVVYLAREVQLARPVAIKVLPPEWGYDTDVHDRFVREARLAAKLSHPNIVPIFAVDQADQADVVRSWGGSAQRLRSCGFRATHPVGHAALVRGGGYFFSAPITESTAAR